MKICLKPSLNVSFRRDGTILLQDSGVGQAFLLKSHGPQVQELFADLRQGLTAEGLQAARASAALGAYLDVLEKKGWLRTVEANTELGTSREKLFSYLAATQEGSAAATLQQLAKKRVLILGCGGTGSAVAQHLLAMGVRQFVLVDDDTVNANNLNRQLAFSRDDYGQTKTHALARFLLARAADAQIETREKRVASAEDVSVLLSDFKPDFLFCGADQPPLRCHQWVTQACAAAQVPCIFGGVGIHDGSWGPLLQAPHEYENYITALNQLDETYLAETFATVGGSLSTTNMLVSTHMAHDIFLHLTKTAQPLSQGLRMRINFRTLAVARVELPAKSSVAK